MKVLLALAVTILLAGCSSTGSLLGPNPTPVNNDEVKAVKAAKMLFDEKYGSYSAQQRTEFLHAGPCLTNMIIPNWVADIAHYPRIDQDDNPQNQCQAYREGQAAHFVELDDQGNYIRAY